MLNLATEFLELSKPGGITLKFKLYKINITQIIKEIVNLNKFVLKQQNIKLVLNLQKKVNFVGDKSRLFRVFQNLIDNATKNTGLNGSIRILLKTSGPNIVFSINNTGTIIPKNEITKIFQPFYVGSRSARLGVSGIGLGLAFASLVVKAHKGKIWAESNPKAGTTFYIVFPKKH